MKRHREPETPFLMGLGIQPQNPWISTGPSNIGKSRSGFSTLELCAGAGGQALGLERAGINHVGLVELNSIACATLRHNRPNWKVIEQDVTTFDATPFAGAEIVSAGLPCPPFSVAGKQLGTLDDRNLLPSMIRVVDQVRPQAVMVERYLETSYVGFRVCGGASIMPGKFF
jgi:DNA (cytosine-5)-methyltransferase 1